MQLAAVRGPIVDRNGDAAGAVGRDAIDLSRGRRKCSSRSTRGRARQAGAAAGDDADFARGEAATAPRRSFGCARHLHRTQAQAAEALGLDGVGAVSEYKRFYPESNLAASVVGLAGMDGQGLSGVELQYDRLVRGEPVELQFLP